MNIMKLDYEQLKHMTKTQLLSLQKQSTIGDHDAENDRFGPRKDEAKESVNAKSPLLNQSEEPDMPNSAHGLEVEVMRHNQGESPTLKIDESGEISKQVKIDA